MTAIITAVVITVVGLLDYWWPHYEQKTKAPERARRIKFAILAGLVAFAWIQAFLQLHRDHQSDTDMEYLKAQLDKANTSLTNSTMAVKGLTTGGDTIPEMSFSQTEETNVVNISMQPVGEYPLRMLWVKVTDEMERINRDRKSTNAPPKDKVVFERFFGDYPAKSWCQLCNVKLDPIRTNFLRFDTQALNGNYWEIITLVKTNENWAIKLHYRWNFYGGKLKVEPQEKSGIIMVDD